MLSVAACIPAILMKDNRASKLGGRKVTKPSKFLQMAQA